jgi:hypothetical protein
MALKQTMLTGSLKALILLKRGEVKNNLVVLKIILNEFG